MPRAEQQRLRALRADLQRQLAERLPDPATPLTELRELQERLRLIDASLPRRGQVRSLLASMLVVALILSAAWLVPVPRVPFTLEATAAQVRLHMPDSGTLAAAPIAGDWLLDGYRAIASADTRLARQAAAGPLAMRGTLRLQALYYPAGATLAIAANGRHLRISAEAPASAAQVALQMGGPIEFAAGEDGNRWSARYPWGEWLRLDYAAAQGAPPPVELAVERSADTPVQWSALKAQSVDFIQRQAGDAAGEARWTSSLKSARVVLPSTRTEATLGAGDGLAMEGLALERAELVAGSDMVLRLAGTASRMDAQVGTYRRSLKPSVLEWVARNHTLGLLWSSALFLWGASAWLRRQWEG